MEKILITAGSERVFSEVSGLLKICVNGKITRSSSGNETRRIINASEPDLIIISTPLNDEFGTELAVTAAEKTSAGIILLCSRQIFDEVSEKLEPYGVCVLSEPADPELFMHSVKLLDSGRARMMNIMKEYSRLQNRIEETRIISRAKCILVQYLKLTEAQAHRYIEKQAMDTRQSRSAVARSILTTYEH